MPPDDATPSTATVGTVLTKLLPLALWIVLAYFAWLSLEGNEFDEAANKPETPERVIPRADDSAEPAKDEFHGGMLLEPSADE